MSDPTRLPQGLVHFSDREDLEEMPAEYLVRGYRLGIAVAEQLKTQCRRLFECLEGISIYFEARETAPLSGENEAKLLLRLSFTVRNKPHNASYSLGEKVWNLLPLEQEAEVVLAGVCHQMRRHLSSQLLEAREEVALLESLNSF